MSKYIVIRDTREQTGWIFKSTQHCEGTEVAGLKTGDYTIKGCEDILCVERKGSITEFANNLVKDWDRFCRELDRMESYIYSFIVLEFSMADLIDYPRSADLPQKIKKKIVVTGSLLLKRLIEIQTKYHTKILFCDDRGQDVVTAIFKNVQQINIATK